jgi:hypothetical protein
MIEGKHPVGTGEYMDRTLALPNEEFKKAMRLENDDKNIDEVEMIAWTDSAIMAYERN